jgi:hypothetical protein
MRRGARRLLAIEMRRNEYRWLFPILLIGSWLTVAEPLDAPVLFWPDVSVRIRNTFWLLGPFAAMVAAWMACRERRFAVEDLLATTARSALQRRLLTWAATTLYALAAYVLVGLYAFAWALTRTDWGEPDWGVILVGCLGIPAYAALGFGLGALKPRRASAFAVFLGLGLATVVLAADNLDWTAFLTPVPRVERSPWSGVTPDVATRQIVYLLGLGALSLGLVARSTHRGWGSRLWLTTAATVVVVSAATIAARVPDATARPILLPGTTEPDPGAPLPGAYRPVCSDAAVPVCVHPAFRPLLDETSGEINRLLAALDGLPDRPTRVELLPVPQTDPPPGTLSLLIRSSGVAGDLMDATHTVAESLLYPVPPDLASAAADASAPASGWQTRNVVLAWALTAAGRPIACRDDQVADHGGDRQRLFLAPCESLQRFAALDPAVRQAWLRDRLSDVRAGLVALEELP